MFFSFEFELLNCKICLDRVIFDQAFQISLATSSLHYQLVRWTHLKLCHNQFVITLLSIISINKAFIQLIRIILGRETNTIGSKIAADLITLETREHLSNSLFNIATTNMFASFLSAEIWWWITASLLFASLHFFSTQNQICVFLGSRKTLPLVRSKSFSLGPVLHFSISSYFTMNNDLKEIFHQCFQVSIHVRDHRLKSQNYIFFKIWF